VTDGRIHSRFGGSSAPRWLNCAGSVALNDATPAPPSGAYADRGSATHELAKLCFQKNLHPRHFIDDVLDGFADFPVDEAMCDDVVTYMNIVETEVARTKTSEIYVERGFELTVKGAEPGEVFGTNDCLVYHPELKRLRVFDFKTGFQDVDVDDNAQLKFYAVGAIHAHPDWKLAEIVLTIVQTGGLGADEKNWTFSVIELLEFMGDVEAAIAKAKQVAAVGGKDAYVAGPWCAKTYCNAFAAGTCPAVAAKCMEGFGMDFGPMTPVAVEDITPDLLPDPSKLDLTQLARIVQGQEYLSAWVNRCAQYLDAMMLAGASAPGWKVVEKMGRAKWIADPARVAGYVDMLFDIPADQLMPRKLITITEAEKRLKAAGATKVQIDDFKLRFTIKESSGRTIARSSDRRPAVDVVAADFAGVKVTAPESIAAE
jgi:hypothetical protein